jgi:AAA+ superfamily predicted ATPase
LVAATNHVELLDRAVFRRFDVMVPFEKPTREEIAALLMLRLGAVGLLADGAKALAARADASSFADVARACDDAIRTMALGGRESVTEADVVAALEDLKRRELPTGS